MLFGCAEGRITPLPQAIMFTMVESDYSIFKHPRCIHCQSSSSFVNLWYYHSNEIRIQFEKISNLW